MCNLLHASYTSIKLFKRQEDLEKQNHLNLLEEGFGMGLEGKLVREGYVGAI